MNCGSLETRIALLIEGDLTTEEAAGLELHLAGCPRCHGFAESLGESQRALKDLAAVDLDVAALAVVRRRVGEALDRPARRVSGPAIHAAAAAVVAALALFVIRSGRDRRLEPPPSTVARKPALAPGPTSPVTPMPARPRAITPGEERVRPGAGSLSAPAPRRPLMSLVPPPGDAGPGPRQERPVIKIVTADPDVVIFWGTDTNGGEP
jgi:hypothetical protein